MLIPSNSDPLAVFDAGSEVRGGGLRDIQAVTQYCLNHRIRLHCITEVVDLYYASYSLEYNIYQTCEEVPKVTYGTAVLYIYPN